MQCVAHSQKPSSSQDKQWKYFADGSYFTDGVRGQESHEGWKKKEIWLLAMVTKEASGKARHLTHIPNRLLPHKLIFLSTLQSQCNF